MNWGKVYLNLLDKSYNRTTEEPTEKHHAYPWHWFGVGKKKDYDWSIVKLTRREHFIAHKLLCRIYPDCPKAHMALWRMMNSAKKRGKYKVNSKTYETHKQIFVEEVIKLRKDSIKDAYRRKRTSEAVKEKWKDSAYREGIVALRKDPTKDGKRRKISSEIMKERWENEEWGNEVRKRNKNLSHMTSEQIAHMRENQKKSRKNKLQVVFLDGTSAEVTTEYYHENKGINCFHASSRKAAEILGRPYKGGRPKNRPNN